MIRENIEYEAKDYAYRNYTANLVDVSIESFIAGAKWADKHPNVSPLWHDVNEVPKTGSNIVVIDKYGQWWVIQPYNDNHNGRILKNWRYYIRAYNNIKRWAYINDLLPQKE